jgi:hypothetical protein
MSTQAHSGAETRSGTPGRFGPVRRALRARKHWSPLWRNWTPASVELWADRVSTVRSCARTAGHLRRPADAAVPRVTRLSDAAGGATIYLKREDLAHTGSHKLNNALGQALLARTMGRTRLIAETGSRPARRGQRNGRRAGRACRVRSTWARWTWTASG